MDMIRKSAVLRTVSHSSADLCDIAQNMRLQAQIEAIEGNILDCAQELKDYCTAHRHNCKDCPLSLKPFACKIGGASHWDL